MSDWNLVYEKWQPEMQPLREALCTLGNGVFATRGAAEESRAGGAHYPGTYIAGGYNRLTTEVAGRDIENEDLVNWPNWLFLSFRHEDGDWFDLDRCEILEFWQELAFDKGTLVRRVRFRDPEGRTSLLQSRRIVSMRDEHRSAIEWALTPEDWSGPIVVRSEIDGNVKNDGVARYRQLRGDHVEVIETGRSEEDEVVWLVSQSTQAKMRVAQAVRHTVGVNGEPIDVSAETIVESNRVGHEYRISAKQGESVTIEKTHALFTAKDPAISEPRLEAINSVREAGEFRELLFEHEQAWDRHWERSDIELKGAQEETERILRLHIFHLLQTTSMNTIGRDVGVPARGWHGEAYRGHIFWDELFIFPFITLRIPELTRSLLLYRYRRLKEARQLAREAGYRGAMFPWQSGSNGREESQALHLNPESGRWIPDTTHRQRHINAAVVYNTWQYYEATGDEEFLSFYGAELILEVAQFWSSLATWNEKRYRYDINGVVGPDEYHTDDPNWDEPGLRNNAYTNIMAAWCLRRALKLLDILPQDRCARLKSDLGVTEEDLARWDDVAASLYIPFHDEGIISQFEGYEALEEFDWEGYQKKYGNIDRLDRILEAENDSPNHYKASKQADVLMLFFLFSEDELEELIESMGYDFDPDSIRANIEYYQCRTSHGSTLSRVVYAWVLAKVEREGSWGFFEQALRSDVADIQGGTTSEGIHLGAMAGTVDLIQRCYTGLELREDTLWLSPQLPDDLPEVEFSFRYRGHTLALRANHTMMEISSCRDGPLPVKVGMMGEVTELKEGQTRRARLDGNGGLVAEDEGCGPVEENGAATPDGQTDESSRVEHEERTQQRSRSR